MEYILAFAGILLGLGIGYFLGRGQLTRQGNKALEDAAAKADRLLADAQTKSERLAEERLQTLEVEWNAKNRAAESEIQEAKRIIRKSKDKLDQRHEKLNRRIQALVERESLLNQATETVETLKKQVSRYQQDAEKLRQNAQELLNDVQEKETDVLNQQANLGEQLEKVKFKQFELEDLVEKNRTQLETLSGLTRQEAKKLLMEEMVDTAKLEAAVHIKEVMDEAKINASKQARKVILTTIQRTASSYTLENTVSAVEIKSEEMKGRIIGREGRNIRAFESVTGVDVIVDDTPEAVILSSFDPVRREVAKIALTRLLNDGRIHPARIEEVVEKVRREIDEEIMEIGQRTLIDLQLTNLHPELIKMVGRMRYRSSYGQNLLEHSIEVAKLSSIMAAELGIDPRKARRAGLLHDIGKVPETDVETPHALYGMELCKKFKEDAEVCNAVGAHHDEIEMISEYSPIVQAADAISGSRPGARREALESYIKRLEKLEEVAGSHNGVERVYAIQAGRELRVIVNHNLVSDAHAEQLAADIAKQIEQEMQYPGQIRVTVIRELRAVGIAK